MFCAKCGAELPERAAFCSRCGEKIPIVKTGVNTAETVNAHSAIGEPEKAIMQGKCNRIVSVLYVQNGAAILTDKRFVYLKHGIGKTLLLGAFVNMTEADYDFDIPLAEIQSLGNGRQGVSKTIIINTKDGQRYNFYFPKRDEWKSSIISAMDALKSKA